ncbi:hypothetical protein [Phaeovulum sp.]|uniref:hypothetical protein n=1 Tax=Phaeovulum sp. TaxID=2934796 RepID=UPI00272FF445|nr:hypothetical protein [Phaeovulum sp.]MDP1668758.1 hypothetical protein [Phaeovulum sp.]MDP3860864.1 hypothetical protein [Phaeovulum sp.]MDZ4120574.1 hypothetical protein [Phaeovulum sp.]
MRRLLICLFLPLLLAACGAEPVWAPDDAVARAVYSSKAPPSITLFTVISTDTGSGAHSALIIDGVQRVLFDPAGTWYHPFVPERNDVHYGITDQMRVFYIDYHARETYWVLEQTVPVSLEVAEVLRARVEAYGAVPKAFCSNSVSTILGGVPGFENVNTTMFPKALSRAFGELPGVTSAEHYDGDPDDNSGVLMVTPAELRAGVTPTLG